MKTRYTGGIIVGIFLVWVLVFVLCLAWHYLLKIDWTADEWKANLRSSQHDETK